MRAAPLPVRIPRRAAVQRADRGPSSIVLGQRPARRVGAADPAFMQRYQEWQDWARKYARTLGIARFPAAITASACRRCIKRVEERSPSGDWIESTDPRLSQSLFDAYRNDRSNAAELVGFHAWHYAVAGECVQVVSDGDLGTQWGIYSTVAIDWDAPTRGMATVRLTPTGNVRDGTAFVVPRAAAQRFWIPDEEWQGYATSPMTAVIDDLHRLWSLNRYARSTADSRIKMSGVYWTPGEAHEDDGGDGGDELGGDASGNGPSQLDRDFATWARQTFSENDATEYAPYGQHWSKEYGAPQWIKIGEGLDPAGVEHRKEARGDVARGIDMPASMAEGGGPGDANHWTEWLVDEKFFDASIAPTMDRITHLDLTRTFLVPVLKFYSLPLDRYRVGYDPAPVIVKPDKSDKAVALHKIGLLAGDATLEACNFDKDERMTAEEFNELITLAKTPGYGSEALPFGIEKTAFGFSTQGGGTQLPTNESAPRTPPEGPPSAPPTQAAVRDPRQVQGTLLARLTQIRRDLGRELLASADQALNEALRLAQGKVVTRARGRKATTADVRAQVVAAAERGDALGPYLAAVGITEQEALAGKLDTFRGHTVRRMNAAARREQAALKAARLDVPASDPAAIDSAADYLTGTLSSLAHRALVDGPLAATEGEVTGAVPASAVARAIDVMRGSAVATLGATADERPSVTMDAGGLEQSAIDALSAEMGPDEGGGVEYLWVWGFYGDPVTPFDRHEDLGASGFTTTDPEGDPALANEGESWLDGEFYHPQDHDGCSCEWVPVPGRAGPTRPMEGEGPMPGPGPGAVDIAFGRGERSTLNVIEPTGNPAAPFGRPI